METTQTKPEGSTPERKKRRWLLILIVPIVLVLLIAGAVTAAFLRGKPAPQGTPDNGDLARRLEAAGTDIIELKQDITVSQKLVINGDKTLTGTGKILLDTALEGNWSENSNPAWGIGCPAVDPGDAENLPAFVTVSSGASLTLNGDAGIDAMGNANGILVQSGAKLTVTDNAAVENGRQANLVIGKTAEAKLSGGKLLEGQAYNVVNLGVLELTGGEITGAKNGAAVYTAGTMTQSGGAVAGAGVHNIYVAAGSFAMTGGSNDGAARDGIVVAQGASAEVTGGSITNCIHGLCNNGSLNTAAVTLNECGIMNYATGTLNLNGTTVDTSEVYCLANNGGKVTAVDFTAKKCDTCAVYNFSGDMELTNLTVTESRDGNLSNAGGNMTVKGARLDACRDKSVTVGNGKAVLDNVAIGGTTNEKYGVYVFGGELYITNSTIEHISSTAVKVDAGAYVELTHVEISDAEQNGFQNDGGEIVASDVSMETLGSHGIYNNGGEITATGLTIRDVEKNAIQHKSGTTTLTDVTAAETGNHGAYVETGVLTVTDGEFSNLTANGFYLVAGENKLVLDTVTISGTGQQGINNNSVVEAAKVQISGTGMNGIYNKEGASLKLSDSVITNATEHGISNKAVMTVTNVKIQNTGSGKNGIQNSGTMTITGAEVTDSQNHGIYNTGTLTGQDVTVKTTAKNGVYNYGGKLELTKLTVSNAGEQGVNNAAEAILTDVTVQNAGANGIYNSKGSLEVKDLTVNGTKEHGISNAAQMTASEVTVQGTGSGKNGIQNSGTMTITGAEVTDSKNHGIYNAGTLTGQDVTVKTTAKNGVYNYGGKLELTKLTVSDAGEQGVNNAAEAILTDVTVQNAGANGIYNSKGSLEVKDLTVNGTKEHGISNAAQMTASEVTVQGTGSGKNGIQNSGSLTMETIRISGSQNHGIYNSGMITGGDVTVSDVLDNGIYNDGGTVSAMTDLIIQDAQGQGINNTGTFTGTTVTISGTGKNGVYNNGGTAEISDLTVTDPGEHGVSNKGILTLKNATLDGSAAGSNGIQNNAELTISSVTIRNSGNHGIYNDSKLISTGTLTITDTAANGIYNYGGTVELEQLVITRPGSHGVNNAGTMTGKSFRIDKATENGIQNTGDFTVTETASITDSGKHGLYSGKRFTGTGIVIENAGDLLLSNAGDMEINALELRGTAHKALYNSGDARLSKVTVLGDGVTNGGDSEYLLDINGGILDLVDATILNAKGTAVHSRGNAATSVTNVIVDHVGNFGFFVEAGSVLSGDGLVVNNVTKNTALIGNAEGIAIKTAGTVTMMDHVTLGAYSEKVTGSGVELDQSTSGIASTAVMVDTDSAGYSGYDLVIKNAPSGNGIYNKGSVFVKDLSVDGCNTGLSCRYNGWATLSGTVELTNTKTNPIRTYGKDDGSKYKNGVTVTSGTVVTIDTAGGHGINNKGSFLAAADSELTIRHITGNNVNAINNNTGTMTLGKVSIDGVYVNVTMHDDTTINTNSGNGINSNGKLTLDGDVTIQNIFTHNANGITDNTIAAGVMLKADASGNGSITVLGSRTPPAGYEDYTGINNGIFVYKCALELKGDIRVSDVANQGIYAADNNAKISARNITVHGAQGNGILINKSNGKLTAAGDITIENAAKHGLSNVGTVSAASITVNGAASAGAQNGIYNNGGTINVAGAISVANVEKGHGINNTSVLTADSVTVRNVGLNGIQNSGNADMKISGAVVLEQLAAHGIYNKKSLTVGSVSITNAARKGINNDGGTLTVNGDLTIDGVTEEALLSSKMVTVTGKTTVRDLTGSDVNAIHNKSGAAMTLKDLVIEDVKVTVGTDDAGKQKTNLGNGIYSEGTVTLNGTAAIRRIYTTAKDNAIGAGVVLYNGGSLTGSGSLSITGSASEDPVYPFGIHNGIFLNGSSAAVSVSLTGDITVQDAANQGIYVANANASLSAGNITVSNTAGNGIYINNANGTLTAAGTITVDTTGQHGLNNVGTVNAGAIRIKTAGKSGINNSGSVTVTKDVSIDGAKEHGLYSNDAITAGGTITVSNATRSGVNIKGNLTAAHIHVTDAGEHGVLVDKGTTLKVDGELTVDGAGKRGISNTQAKSSITAGSIRVSNVRGDNGIINGNASASIQTGSIEVSNVSSGCNGLYNSGSVTVTDRITVSDISGTSTKTEQGNGIFNKGTMKANGAISVQNVTASGNTDKTSNNGIYTTGSITAASITVDTVAAGYGMYIKGCTVKAEAITIQNITKGVGIYQENKSTMEAGTITVDGTGNQAYQLQHANTLTADRLIIRNSQKNGLRIYNNNSNPTVNIGEMAAVQCKECAVAAQKKITSTNLHIGTLWWQDCKNGALHKYINSGVDAVKNELPEWASAPSGQSENREQEG